VQEIRFDDVEQPEAREMRYTIFIYIFIVDMIRLAKNFF
jgi:hypothetical protein